MWTAAALLFLHGGQMCRILLIVVFFKEAVGLCFLFCFAEVYAFLLWVVRFLRLATITFDMRGSFLALLSAVLALCDRPALFGYEDEFTVYNSGVSRSVATKPQRRTYLYACIRLLGGP